MRYSVRPLSDRTWLRPDGARVSSRFDSTWTSTLQLLGSEIDRLDGRDVVIEIDVAEHGIRKDGELRSDARAESPAVVVAFEGKPGPMQYRCDRFVSNSYGRPDWQQNVRAVALTLESLRAVDRYGATDTGQQYAGFKALGAGTAMPSSHMTGDEARALLLDLAGYCDLAADWSGWSNPVLTAKLLRSARFAAHPDRNDGQQALWDQVEQAAQILGLSS